MLSSKSLFQKQDQWGKSSFCLEMWNGFSFFLEDFMKHALKECLGKKELTEIDIIIFCIVENEFIPINLPKWPSKNCVILDICI